MEDEPLSRLAEAAGLALGYWDIDGREHRTSPDAIRHLLGALGLPAGTAEEISKSHDRLIREKWQETLPPVQVIAADRPFTVLVRRPSAAAREPLRWSILLESGTELAGDADFAALPVAEAATIEDEALEARQFELPALPLGYHQLRLAESTARATIIASPGRCHLPPDFAQRRTWGLSVQLYGLKSSENWGIGDFTDLGRVVGWAAEAGAGAVGVDPLHVLFVNDPASASPYSPSSRLFLNPLHLDLTAIEDFAEAPEARRLVDTPANATLIEAARQQDLVSYATIGPLKLEVLARMHQHFAVRHLAAGDERAQAFAEFVTQAGDELEHLVLFQALVEHFGTGAWWTWPPAFQGPRTAESIEFARTHEDRLSLFRYLQWQCDLQLAGAERRSRESGMQYGLYRDLAVGVGAGSADHWANQQLFAGSARVGAPPDPFNESGQEWGLVPLNPRILRATGYAHFIALLRANMRYAGALRIDHVMGWQRLFVIPAGAAPAAGTYLSYPIADLLAIAALESQRHHCALIGEDLGTVPEGFRERLGDARVLSCRVLYFEGVGDRFRQPHDFPELAAVSASTHDLATIRGYWLADDIEAKARLGIFLTPEEEQRARHERHGDLMAMLWTLAEAGLIARPTGDDPGPWTPALSTAMHLYLARSRPQLLMVQLCDLEGEIRQANLPGTTTQYPNWQIRMIKSLDEVAADPEIAAVLAALTSARAQ